MGKKGNKRKTRWRVLPIAGDDGDCAYSTNEDDGEADHVAAHVAASPSADGGTGGGPGGPSSYARAMQPGRGKPGTKPRPSGYQPSYYRPHRPLPDRQPLVTAEKKTFNEEEYTKITTPRQDVLFKKGYLGRKRAAAASAAASSASSAAHVSAAAVTGVALTAVNVTNGAELASVQNGGDCEQQPVEPGELLSPVDEQPQYIYSNGYVDHGVIYMNGSYEWGYDPYGNVAVVVGPAPAYASAGGAPPVLAAVPCQPLPLQPLEWFNPAYSVQYVAPLAAPLCPRDRRKRSSADSQNCSPQSSESTEPPGSPQEGDGDVDGDGEEGAAAMANGIDEYGVYPQPQAPSQHNPQPQAQQPPYMYPGTYMFGPPFYSMNGITVQGAPQLHQNVDNSGSKRRKKKRRRRRRRGGVDDGSEESSSDDKDLEEPVSLTSQESSQEVESDSKNSEASANCPTIVGCPELPDREPEAASLSQSPSLSPSPSPSAVTENKTVSSNSLLFNKTYENIQLARFEDSSNKKEKLFNHNSVSQISYEHYSEQPAAVECEYITAEFQESKTNQETPNVFHNTACNTNTNLLNFPKVKQNTPETVKSSKTGSNKLITDNFPLQNSKEQEELGVPGKLNSKLISNCSVNGKENLRFRKGSKSHKQKNQQAVFNGFTEVHINDKPSKGFSSTIKMDGNEASNIGSNNPLKNAEETGKVDQYKVESRVSDVQVCDETSPKSELHENVSAQHFLEEAPKRPSRTHYHHHHHKQLQQQELLTDVPRKRSSLGKEESKPGIQENFAVSMTSEGNVKITATSVPPNELYTSPEKSDSESDPHSAIQVPDTSLYECATKQTSFQLEESDDSGTKEEELQISNHEAVQGKDVPQKCSLDNSILLANNSTRRILKENSFPLESKEDEKSATICEEQRYELPPVPPPRRKKWQPNRKLSAERPPTPGRELEAQKLTEVLTDDSSSSSSSHESEESVIDLLSSTPSPNNKLTDLKQTSSEDEEEVIFEGQILSNTISVDQDETTSSPSIESLSQDTVYEVHRADEANVKTADESSILQDTTTSACIFNQPQCVSTGDQIQHKHADVQTVLFSDFYGNECAEEESSVSGNGQEKVAKTYADGMINKVLDEGLSAASEALIKTQQQQQSLSITEAVTQWLHTQDSEEVLPVPLLLEPESEMEESEEELNMTGPKNVYRNPLLASSYELENIYDDAGTRVAFQEITILSNKNYSNVMDDYNETKRILNLESSLVGEQLFDSVDSASSCAEVTGVSTCHTENTEVINHKNETLGNKNISLQNSESLLVTESEIWRLSFDSKSMEYDADWECDPIVLKPSLQTTALFARDDQESYLSFESSDDKCSHMCDPTRSVAKYYRLGSLPEKDANQQISDCYLGADDSEDEIDALVHFKKELGEHSQNGGWLEGTSDESKLSRGMKTKVRQKSNSYEIFYDDHFTSDSGVYSEESGNEDYRKNSSNPIPLTSSILQRKSAVLVSHLSGDSPFPCGGICCILQ